MQVDTAPQSPRRCQEVGCLVAGGTLFMHKLDGYHSGYDRIVWLCPVSWARAQVSPVEEVVAADVIGEGAAA